MDAPRPPLCAINDLRVRPVGPGATFEEKMAAHFTFEVQQETTEKNGCRNGVFNWGESTADGIAEQHDERVDGFEEVLANEGVSGDVREQVADWLQEAEDQFDARMNNVAYMEKVQGQVVEGMGETLPDCDAILAGE